MILYRLQRMTADSKDWTVTWFPARDEAMECLPGDESTVAYVDRIDVPTTKHELVDVLNYSHSHRGMFDGQEVARSPAAKKLQQRSK